MGDKDQLFSQSTYDLGSYTLGDTAASMDSHFKSLSLTHASDIKCIVCTQPPKYKLVPKDARLLTAELEDRGYVCEHCLVSHFDRELYKIKKL